MKNKGFPTSYESALGDFVRFFDAMDEIEEIAEFMHR